MSWQDLPRGILEEFAGHAAAAETSALIGLSLRATRDQEQVNAATRRYYARTMADPARAAVRREQKRVAQLARRRKAAAMD